ncbi:MAG: hypothetical protein NUV57_02505 [archaeon]|nr:hypothetical protein [archaeon]
MGWLSRLLGEMPEETKYKATSSFKVKDIGDSIQVTSQPIENYQNEDAAKLFINKYREKYDSSDELNTEKPRDSLEALFSNIHSVNSLEDLMKNMNSTEKEIITNNNEELSGIFSKLAIGTVIFFIMAISAIAFFTANDFGSIFPILFWVLLIIILSAGKQKFKTNLTDSRK